MAHLFGEGELSRVGKHDGRIVATFGYVINHDIVEHAGVVVLALHQQVVAGDFAIEYSLGNFKFGRLLLDREKQSPHLDLSVGEDIVLEEECSDRDGRDKENEGCHHTQQRDAGGFHGCQFKFFAKVAKCHQRSQQYSERQRHRHHRDCSIEEQLADDRYFKPFAYEVVDVFPEELHQHDEEHDEKSHREKRQESLQHK